MGYPRILSLFSGVGGLELGIRIACPPARAVAYVERDAYAASALLARMEDSAMEPAPVFVGDIQDLDGRELSGRVDLVCGGFPCQDISAAGKGDGIDGSRSGLFFELMRVICEVGPRYVFLENVSMLTVRGLDRVLGSLAESGFDAEWLCLRASDVGAPHRRERWFCLAYRDGNTPERASGTEHDAFRGGGDQLAHGLGSGLEERRRIRRDDGPELSTVERGAATRGTSAALPFPPSPGDREAWGAVIADAPHLAPAIEPGVRVLADGMAYVLDISRADQLRCCGNGVVPLQASLAFVELARRACIAEVIGVRGEG